MEQEPERPEVGGWVGGWVVESFHSGWVGFMVGGGWVGGWVEEEVSFIHITLGLLLWMSARERADWACGYYTSHSAPPRSR